MATLTVSLPAGTTVCNGKQITFRAPCDCTGVTGIIINGTTYELVDTSNECISDKGNQFASGAMVSVIMDTENSRAYIQNAAAGGGASVEEMTYEEYMALETKDPDTMYVVTDVELFNGEHASQHAADGADPITPEMIGAAATDHTQAASTITAGTFAGQVVANSGGETYSTYLLRNTCLAPSDTTPSNNGEICWTYG